MSQATIYLSNTALSGSKISHRGEQFLKDWGESQRDQAILNLEREIDPDPDPDPRKQRLQTKWSDIAAQLREQESMRIADRVAALERAKSA